MTRSSNYRKHWRRLINILVELQFLFSFLFILMRILILTWVGVGFLIEFCCHLIEIFYSIDNRQLLLLNLNILYTYSIILQVTFKIRLELMFDQLLASFETTLKQAKSTQNSLSKQLKQTQNQFGVSQEYFHDPTRTLGKAVSFPKSDRFKPLQKQQPRTTDSFYDLAAQPENQIMKGPTFKKSMRFMPDQQDQMTIINPNYDVVKKNNKQAPKIAPVSKQQLEKSRLSQATAASITEVGPGKYFINQTQVTNRKKPSFSKSKRFEKEKKQYQDTPLFLNEAQTKKRPPMMAVIKKKTQKNKNQISAEKQQELRQRLKLVYWKSIPVELDRLLKKHLGAPILKQNYFNLKKLTGVERRAALLMMIERLNYQRGGFQNNIETKLDEGPCAVVYRKSTPKPFKFSEMDPGPDYYYPQDDIIKPAKIGYTFAKRQQKPMQPDNRDYQINDQFLKTGGNIIILPEHKPHVLTQQQIRSLNRGPGFYDCLFKQVQKRNDIGIVKFAEITEKNARQNNCVQIREVNDGIYYPSYEAIDPKVPAPVYSKPSNVKPAHMPDKQLFPEHWLFYDGDLNKVRAQIAKNVLIGNGLAYQEYQTYTKKLSAFKNYMQLRRKQAQLLEYQPKYEVVDPHIQGFDMAKKPQKTLIDPIVKPQFGLDGDNLLLQPEKLKKKLPDVNFKKMVGREDEQIGQDDVIQGDVLIIQPKKIQKHIAQIDFNRMVSRPEIKNSQNQDEEPAEGDRILINPKLPQKKLPNIDFSKQVNVQRQPIDLEKVREQKQQLDINPHKPKNIKGFVEMERMTSVRLVPILRKNRKQKQKASTIKVRSKEKRQQISQQNKSNVPGNEEKQDQNS